MNNQPEKLKSAESDTPRTDTFAIEARPSLEVISSSSWAKRVLASHKQLERELNDAKKEKLNAYKAGMRRVIKHLQKMIDDYDAEHGFTDIETGTREYPKGGDDYLLELTELQEAILTLSETIKEEEME